MIVIYNIQKKHLADVPCTYLYEYMRWRSQGFSMGEGWMYCLKSEPYLVHPIIYLYVYCILYNAGTKNEEVKGVVTSFEVCMQVQVSEKSISFLLIEFIWENDFETFLGSPRKYFLALNLINY